MLKQPEHKVRFGGSFAPPLPPTKCKEYRKLAVGLTPEIAQPFLRLCDMHDHFCKTPESKLAGSPHPSGTGVVIPLDDKEKERICDCVPFPHELEMYGKLFDQIDPGTQKELRNAAYHLLWYGRELANGREPITNDKI